MFRSFILAAGLLSASLLQQLTPSKTTNNSAPVAMGSTALAPTGPALLPESLARLRKTEAVNTITKGRVATQMGGFADRLSAQDIDALVAYIYTPVSPAPHLHGR